MINPILNINADILLEKYLPVARANEILFPFKSVTYTPSSLFPGVACHGPDLGGGEFGPPLRGVNFRNRWAGATMGELFDQLKQMPPGGGAGLSDSVHADLAALILAENVRTALQAMAMPGERPKQQGGQRLSSLAKLPFYPTPPNPLDKITPVTDALLSRAPEGEWLQWRRTWDANAYSPLKQITKSNVKRLVPVWHFSTANNRLQCSSIVKVSMSSWVHSNLGPLRIIQMFISQCLNLCFR